MAVCGVQVIVFMAIGPWERKVGGGNTVVENNREIKGMDSNLFLF